MCREKIRKAKVQLESYLATAIKHHKNVSINTLAGKMDTVCPLLETMWKCNDKK